MVDAVNRASQNHAVGLDTQRQQLLARARLLWEHRRLLFKAGVYGLVFFAIVAFLIPKRYQSTTLLMPPDDQSNSGMAMAAALAGKMNGGLAGLASGVLGLKSSGDLFIGMLRSRTVEDDLINKYDLQKIYKAPDEESARTILGDNTSISEDHKSGIITIKVVDRDPRLAASLAREYVGELNVVVSQLSTSSARRERMFLEDRLAQVKKDLESAEKDFSEFSSKNATIDIKDQGKAMLDSAANLQGQLITTQSELEGLKQIYSDKNIRVRSLTARAMELQSQLDKLGGKSDNSQAAVSSNDGSLYPSLRKLPLLGVAYADLYRRTKVEEAVYESLTQEYELAKVAEAKEIPSVKVLDPANVPHKKSSPPRLVIMVLGAIFSFVTVVAWVLGKASWEQLDPRTPHKLFVTEVAHTLNSYMPWEAPHGSRVQAAVHRLWMRFSPRHSSQNQQ